MKRLFIVLCDIMFLCMIVAPASGVVWLLSVLCGWNAAGPAKIVCIIALAGCAVFVAASFAVWKHTSESDGHEEGEK